MTAVIAQVDEADYAGLEILTMESLEEWATSTTIVELEATINEMRKDVSWIRKHVATENTVREQGECVIAAIQAGVATVVDKLEPKVEF